MCDELEEALLSRLTDFGAECFVLTMTYFVDILCTAVAVLFEIASSFFL
jgi:hypothetical protein